MTDQMVFPDWRELVQFAAPGPEPTIVAESPIPGPHAGLEPGGRVRPHAAPRAVYHFLEGEGVIIVDGESHRWRRG